MVRGSSIALLLYERCTKRLFYHKSRKVRSQLLEKRTPRLESFFRHSSLSSWTMFIVLARVCGVGGGGGDDDDVSVSFQFFVRTVCVCSFYATAAAGNSTTTIPPPRRLRRERESVKAHPKE